MVAEVIAADRPTTPLLPAAIRDARLPSSYTEARAALERCDSLDECCTWSSKAAALASYARQAHDSALERLARRIRLRAVRRCGEILQKIPAQRGRRSDLRPDIPIGARTKAATAAGLSESRHRASIRLAKIPAQVFEAAVESEPPPGVTALAGRAALRPPPDMTESPRDPFGYVVAVAAIAMLVYAVSRAIPSSLWG
jgi:hypothetical protein